MPSLIADNLNTIRATLPSGVSLVAVSKFHPADAIRQAYDAGQRIFGESRANEFVDKAQSLPDDICWHFIGHLQTNKVRQILPYTSLIHSVDSERLLRLIDTESKRIDRRTDVLLQIHVALEETKFGFSPAELQALLDSGVIDTLQSVRVRGVMGMASNVDDNDRITADFQAIARCFDMAHSHLGNDCDILSMGMSHDYPLAIASGANMVRVGSSIFGERCY